MEDLSITLSRILDKGQMDSYEEVMAFLRAPLPDYKASDYRPYLQNNAEYQNFLGSTKAQLQYAMSKKRSALFKRESELKVEAKDEKLASGERAAYCFGDAKYTDMREELDLYEVVYERLNGLEWLLKSLANKL